MQTPHTKPTKRRKRANVALLSAVKRSLGRTAVQPNIALVLANPAATLYRLPTSAHTECISPAVNSE